MGLLDKFIKAKEAHCIEKYCEDGEPCLECTQGDSVRVLKIEGIMELLHIHHDACTLKDDENGEKYLEVKDGDDVKVFTADDIKKLVETNKEKN